MEGVIDVHVHLAALPEGENGCHISRKMLRSPLFRLLIWRHGLDLNRPAIANSNYVKRILNQLDHSEKVGRAVLLGMDGVYDEQGRLDLAATDFLISNRYVLEVAKRYPDHFLAGVSINPKRRDAIEELERCVQAGAVLVKVLPNTQRFDPSDKRYVPFYRALAKHHMPLLSHVGFEFSLIGKDQSMGNPRRLQVPLEEGVCVIAAHSCSFGLFFPEPYFKVFLEFAHRYPQFYADTSALTLPNRVKTLMLVRRYPELHARLIFGTDYPLPVFSYPALRYSKLAQARSPFDRQALVFESLGIRFKDFSALINKGC
jgi:predicted TIM-barrel fold metal-dependent hydrolase